MKRTQRHKGRTPKSGRPLTTSELATLVGMSSTFIRKEIGSGYLRATLVGRGRKRVFRIPLEEARRYVRDLGLLALLTYL